MMFSLLVLCCVQGFKDIQSDYEKRLKEVEARESSLLRELESRETSLVSKTSTLEDDLRQLQKQVKQLSLENEHLSDLNSQLMGKYEKEMRAEERLREKAKLLEEESTQQRESYTDLNKELERMREKMNEKGDVVKSNEALKSTIEGLRADLEDAHQRLLLLEEEREELQLHVQDTTEALNDEREAKVILEDRLRDYSTGPSLASEPGIVGSATSPSLHADLSPSASAGNGPYSTLPVHPPSFHSSPLHTQDPRRSTPRPHSLFEELNHSTSSNDSAVQSLQAEVKELRQKLVLAEAERQRLEEKVSNLTRQLAAEKQGDVETGSLLRRVRELEDQVATKEAMVEQMRRKVEESSKKNAQSESEIDRLSSSLEEAKKLMAAEVGEKKEEVANKEKEMAALLSSLEELREEARQREGMGKTLETVITNTENEAKLLSGELKKFLVSIRNAQVNRGAKVSDAAIERMTSPDLPTKIAESSSRLKLWHSAVEVEVQEERRCLLSVLSAKDLVQCLREHLESFKKALLEATITAAKSQPSAAAAAASDREEQTELETAKLNSKLKAKIEEVDNLKIILRARTATQEVVISQLKSKLESETKANQSEHVRLRYELRRLEAQCKEQLHVIATYESTLREYATKFQQMKQDYYRLKDDKEELEMYLNATIKKKIELAEKLEEFEIERERCVAIPQYIGATRV